MNQHELQECLIRKLKLIQSITANNESQHRLLRRRNLRAIRRLLRERSGMITELIAIENQLSRLGSDWKHQDSWQDIAQTISRLQAAMLASCQQVIQTADNERRQIAIELKNIKNARQLKNHYAPSWQGVIAGRRLSVKG